MCRLCAEAPAGDSEPNLVADVRLETRNALDGHTSKWRLRLEDHERTPGVAFQMSKLCVALGNHNLQLMLMESEPHRRHGRSPILAICRQHGRGGLVEKVFRITRPVV